VLVAALVRGSYEFQGQKCSVTLRAYIPDSIWPIVKERLLTNVVEVKMGDVADFADFMGGVIDQNAFASISACIEYAKSRSGLDILVGGGCDDSTGYFIDPTIVESGDPKSKLMAEEIFGPVLTV